MRFTGFGLFLLSGLLACPAYAATKGGCAALRQPATAAQRTADAALVTRIGKQKVSAAQVSHVLAEGSWRLVWATPSDAERGVFFFNRTGRGAYHLVDVWGGVIAPEDRAGSIAWARGRAGHPSARLATCFVDAVVAGK